MSAATLYPRLRATDGELMNRMSSISVRPDVVDTPQHEDDPDRQTNNTAAVIVTVRDEFISNCRWKMSRRTQRHACKQGVYGV
jgi:hypothetical protein